MTVSEHTPGQASSRGEMKWVHQRKAAGGLLCAERARLRLRHVAVLGPNRAGDERGLRGSLLPKPALTGWAGRKALPGCRATTGRAGFQFPASLAVQELMGGTCFSFAQQLCAGGRAAAVPVSAFCGAHMGNVRSVVLCWSHSGQSLLNLSLKWHFHVGDRMGVILRQAVREQSSAMSENQTAEQWSLAHLCEFATAGPMSPTLPTRPFLRLQSFAAAHLPQRTVHP